MTSLLGRLFPRRDEDAPPLAITVYSRQGCGCCVKAKDVLDGFRGRYRIEVEEVDVDQDPALRDRYGMEVPVVAVAGKVRCRGQVDPRLLERLLRAEAPRG
ncbi:glutaredoxin family protein [Paludisphaera sp.]|uniref:glutaredoxin family protein n=1 Tax=Paludisphaera sp. TaxID=2017432 RepID=UPI00301DCA90